MSLIEGMKILDNLSFNQNLKPDNILLDSKMIHKIIDFDSAWIINRTFLNEYNVNLIQIINWPRDWTDKLKKFELAELQVQYA